MTPDDLRALADALEPMAKAPRFEDFDVPAFCAWVRACADEKPVGMLTVAAFRGHLENRDFDYTGDLPDGNYPLYTHPAPAVPHPSADASRDAYEGCREDLLDWKRRALKAEREARNLAINALRQLVAERDAMAKAFLELHATVVGECPALLNEDSGGSSLLIELVADALAQIEQERPE